MSFFIYNGVSSDDLGLIITNPIVRPTWAREVEQKTIPGRSKPFRRLKDNYTTADLSIKTVIADAGPDKVHKIYSVLKDSGILVVSTAPHEFLNVTVQPLVPEPVALLMAELPITFTCEPFANAIEETTIDLLGARDTWVKIYNNGTVFCDPTITFNPKSPSTTFNINGAEFIVTTPSEILEAGGADNGYEVVADCEAEICYYIRPNGEKVACTQCTKNNFPRLHEGENYIKYDSEMWDCSMTMRERWL